MFVKLTIAILSISRFRASFCLCLWNYTKEVQRLKIWVLGGLIQRLIFNSRSLINSRSSVTLKPTKDEDLYPCNTEELRLNSTDKNLVCQICGRWCSSKSSLLTHLRVHTGEKPFVCDMCGKRFTQKATLQRHRHLHTGEKHFKCDHCGKRFYRKDKLYEHLNVHKQNRMEIPISNEIYP